MKEPSPEVAREGFSKHIGDCEQVLQDAFRDVRLEFCRLHPDYDLHVDYTWRGPVLQMALFQKGREWRNGEWVLVDPTKKVTDKDGTIKKGKHNFYPSKAADIYIKLGRDILWGTDLVQQALYVELAGLWKAHGVASGALWKTFKDWPHVEVA